MGWPYLWFSLFAIAIEAGYAIAFGNSVMETIVIDVYKSLSLYGIMAIWYLPSYAIATYITLKEQNKRTRRIVSLVFVGIAIITDYLLRWIQGISEGNIFFLIYYPLSSFIRGLLCSFYIAVGYELHNFLNFRNKQTCIFLCVVCFILSIGLSPFCVDANLSKLYFGYMPGVFFICSIAGSVAFTSLFFMIKNTILCKSRFLQYCGINSLLFLITHMTFKLPEIAWKVEKVIFGARGYGIIQNLQGIVCLIIILIFEIPIVFLLKNTRLKIFVDRKANNTIDV